MTKHRLGLHTRLCFHLSRTKRPLTRCFVIYLGCYFHLSRTKRPLTTCPLPSEATSLINHKTPCFSLAENLIVRGLFDSARKVIRRIIKQCPSVSEAISAVEFSISRGVEPDAANYGFLIRQLVTSGETHKTEVVYVDCILNRGIEPNHFLLNSMVICYCKLGKLEEAKLLVDKLVDMNSMPCSSTCNELIKGFCGQGRILDGCDVFVKAINADVLRAFSCYNKLVDGLCFRGYLDEALCVFDEMCDRGVPPTVHLFKTLVLSFCKRGRVEEAQLLSMDMESYGFVLDKVMYTALINVYSKTQKMKTAMLVFHRMLKLGCEPDKYTYNTLINGFTNTKCHSYTALISALYKENQSAKVDDLYRKMLYTGLVPDHVLFFTLINNHPKGSEISLARTFLRAIAKNGCGIDLSYIPRPTSHKVTSDIMLDIDCLLGEIVARNLPLASVAFNIYMIALCLGGELDSAQLCMDKMATLSLQPSLSAYNSMIKCLYQKGLPEDAKFLVEVMQDQGQVPNQATFLIMVNEYCKQGDIQSALEVLDQMEESGLKPSVAIYDSVIGCLGRKKRIDEALGVFWRMIEEGFMPNTVLHTSLRKQFLRKREFEFAFKLVDLMERSEIERDLVTYIILVSGVSRNIRSLDGKVLVPQRRYEESKEMLFRLLHQSAMLPKEIGLEISVSFQEQIKYLALWLINKVKRVILSPKVQDILFVPES
ncbi:pentatricopeptide repeat-containing protein At5g62370-like [Solanum dulcamara]|uniref:pentatricopeptide repeat-containing protein At5g62370-like n=1 Tax=Solanum dulcamara TaxID=45834 RepID=UPI0024851612|nr:pentatricopeptide repeat-containing protein At5g62370-like [Solanum dulcamara]